jgi:hypothetical protein
MREEINPLDTHIHGSLDGALVEDIDVDLFDIQS